MLNATQSYRQAQVTTVNRAEVTLMLYDGLLRFLDLAAEKMEQKKIQEKGNLISRALDIINELDSTLNMEQGGEVSRGLHNLYSITNKNLLMANLKNDIEMLKSVRSNMQVVRDSFYEAMQTPEAKQMLAKMGPMQQGSATSNAPMQLGGSIQERANRIKEAQQKVDAINAAKKRLEQAKTDEERALAKAELEKLVGAGVMKTATKPVSMSMAQKANKAFMQQHNEMARPMQQTQQVPTQMAQKPVMPNVQNNAGQVGQQPVSPLQRQSALFGQSAMANMGTVQSNQATQANVTGSVTATPQTTIQQNAVGQSEVGNTMQNTVAQPTMQKPVMQSPVQSPAQSPMASGLLGKKMALYKNSQA